MKITFEGNTTAEVLASIGEFVGAISGAIGAPGAIAAPAPGPGRPVGAKDSTPRTRKPNKAVITTTAVVAPQPTSEQLDRNAAPAPSALPDSPPKLSDAQAALAALFEAKGMQDSLKVLAAFKVKKVQELKPTDFAEFIAKAYEVAAM